jgi:hypothetical protein
VSHGNVPRVKQSDADALPKWRSLRAGPWDFIHEPGLTGCHVRRVPPDLLKALKSESESNAGLNPWERLGQLAPQDNEGDIATYRAGASYWNACARIAHIATGAATRSSDAVQAFAEGARDPWTWGRIEDRWFGYQEGRQILDGGQMSQHARAEYASRRAEWERRKRGRSKAEAKPKGEFAAVGIESVELVRYWLAGFEGWPGFAWSSDKVGAAICGGVHGQPTGGFLDMLTAKGFFQSYHRLGLKKALPEAYSAEIGRKGITLLRRGGEAITRLVPRKPSAGNGPP